MKADVHPEEDVHAWEAAALWVGCLISAGLAVAAVYAVARWVIAPAIRWAWSLLQPLIPLLQQHGEQLVTAALLAAVVMAIFAIAREK